MTRRRPITVFALSLATWLRAIALMTMIFATPMGLELVRDVAGLIDACEDECEDDCADGECCPGACDSCACCVHAVAMTFVPPALPKLLESWVQIAAPEPVQTRSSGYRSPPFRPPAHGLV